ncbi:hypothetical protein LUZ60_005002 [Juncus effusus]|nr:hypothetical protein LUZ60_005002 [Juncus effusus]
MGNYISFTHNWCLNEKKELISIDSDDASHEGIRTIKTQKMCEFSNSPALCICIITWNMNGKMSVQDLKNLVAKDRNFDLLVIGFQEVPKTNLVSVLQEAVCETHRLLGQKKMQSLHLYLFASKSSEAYIREIKVDKQAVGGCGGLIGRKKGAVAIYVNFSGIRMVFISCHLAAHEHKVEERNSECKHISHSLFSKHPNISYTESADVTIWLGDLNYRLQGINTMPARNLIHENLQNVLTRKDQLLQEAEKGEIFNGYCEGTLSFKPSYKYNIGTSNYDTSHKIRVPSWTDRILFKIDHASNLYASLKSYESIDSIESSDHKPVKAHLCLRAN